SVPGVQHRSLAARRPRAANRRRQHIAGFIEKYQVRVPLSSLRSNLRKAHPFEEFNGGLVSFTGPALRLLRRPVQPLAQKPAHMIVMERDSKMTLNQNPDARTRPQLIRPAVGFGALQQQVRQATMLLGRQAWRRAG